MFMFVYFLKISASQLYICKSEHIDLLVFFSFFWGEERHVYLFVRQNSFTFHSMCVSVVPERHTVVTPARGRVRMGGACVVRMCVWVCVWVFVRGWVRECIVQEKEKRPTAKTPAPPDQHVFFFVF